MEKSYKKIQNLKILNNKINYLKNLPKKLKIYFQNYNIWKNFYKMDTIKGLKLSYLLNNLTKDDLTNITKIKIIHSSKVKIKHDEYL